MLVDTTFLVPALPTATPHLAHLYLWFYVGNKNPCGGENFLGIDEIEEILTYLVNLNGGGGLGGVPQEKVTETKL